MKRIIAIGVVLVTATPTFAEDVLLDIHRNVFCFRCNPVEPQFGFFVGREDPGMSHGGFYVTANSSVVGQEFFLPEGPDLVGIEGALTWPDHVGLLGGTGPTSPWYSVLTFGSGALTDGGVGPTISITRHVPVLGPSLFGYDITAVSITVDRFEYTPVRSDFNGVGEFTIRIYGNAVPEPATWVLVWWGMVLIWLRHSQKK